MFSSWFNRGFLVLRRIDWSTPASVLEKIIRYEAVHRIRGWDDLRRRIDPPDRRCYAFFHPALVDDPLIFVEVALTREIPSAIAPILTVQRDVLGPDKATTAVFYSISNCQRGLDRRLLRPFPDQAGGRGDRARDAEALDLRDAVAGRRTSPSGSSASAPTSSRGARARTIAPRSPTSIPPGWWQTEKTREPVRGAADPRGGLVLPACPHAQRQPGRCGRALPSRQWRAARAAELARRRRPSARSARRTA